MIENKASINGEEIVEVQRSAFEHRAVWTGLTYAKGDKNGSKAEIEGIIREAIAETGKIHGEQIKANCKNLEDVTKFLEVFLNPTVKKTFEMEFKTVTSDRLDIEFHYCPLLKAWQDLGFDEETCATLCDMAMDGDRNIAKSMGYEFHLGDTLAKGCKTCQVSFFKPGK